MHNNELDKIFRDKLSENRQFNIPVSHIEDMNSRIRKRKTIRIKKTIIISFIVTLVVSVFGILVIERKIQDRSEQQLDITEYMASQTIFYGQNTKLIPSISRNKPKLTNSKGDSFNTSKEQISHPKLTIPSSNHKIDTGLLQTNVLPSKIKVNYTPPFSKKRITSAEDIRVEQNIEPGISTSNIDQQKSVNFSNTSDLTHIQQEEIIENNTSELTEIEQTSDSNSATIKLDKTPVITTLNTPEKINTDSVTSLKKDTIISKLAIDSLQIGTKTLTDSVKDNNLDGSELTSEIKLEKNDDSKKHSFEISMYGGAKLMKGRLSTLSTTQNSDFNLNQKPKFSEHFGLNGTLTVNSLSYSVGIESHKYIDEVNFDIYEQTTSTYDSIKIVIKDSVIYDTQGNPIDTITYVGPDTTTYTIIDSTLVNRNSVNTYKIISFPVSLGYSFTFNTWLIRPQVNGLIELTRQSTNGTYPLKQNDLTNISTLSTSKLTYSLGLDCHIRKSINNYYYFVQPGYRVKLSNLAANSDASIKHNSLHVFMGIGYRFK